MKKITVNIKAVLRLLLLVVGIFATLNGIVLTFTTNLNIGNLLTLFLGVFFLLWSVFYNKVSEKFPKVLKIVIIVLLAMVIAFCSFLFIYGSTNSINYEEDAIIVLGAGVHGEKPSRVLKDRLNAVLDYHSKNPDALIVVSGGKGPQESVTEAYAMEKYLLDNGVPKESIIKEEKATSTYENFTYSKELLDEYCGGDYTVAFISNEYHIYRASGIAKSAGISDITYFHSTTRWYSILPGTLRECLAVAKFWVLDK